MKRQPTTTKTRFAHILSLFFYACFHKLHLIRLNINLKVLSRILNYKTALKSEQTPRKTHKNIKATDKKKY